MAGTLDLYEVSANCHGVAYFGFQKNAIKKKWLIIFSKTIFNIMLKIAGFRITNNIQALPKLERNFTSNFINPVI